MEVITLAGSTEGFKDGLVDKAQFNYHTGIAIAKNGNIIVADSGNDKIRLIDRETGEVSTIAGSTRGFKNGYVDEAQFYLPGGIAIDKNGNIVVADTDKIRLINMETGVVSTIAGSTLGFEDGSLYKAQFNHPNEIAIDRNGNIVVADTGNHRIRLINLETKEVSTIAGYVEGFEDGHVNEAQFNNPYGIAIDVNENIVVADTNNHRIRLINVKTEEVTTLAGSGEEGFQDGSLDEAQFSFPGGIAIDKDGNIVVADTVNHRIRFIDMESGEVSTLAGSTQGFQDGSVDEARFNNPYGVAIHGDGNIVISDINNDRIRMIKPKSGGMTKSAGRGK